MATGEVSRDYTSHLVVGHPNDSIISSKGSNVLLNYWDYMSQTWLEMHFEKHCFQNGEKWWGNWHLGTIAEVSWEMTAGLKEMVVGMERGGLILMMLKMTGLYQIPFHWFSERGKLWVFEIEAQRVKDHVISKQNQVWDLKLGVWPHTCSLFHGTFIILGAETSVWRTYFLTPHQLKYWAPMH